MRKSRLIYPCCRNFFLFLRGMRALDRLSQSVLSLALIFIAGHRAIPGYSWDGTNSTPREERQVFTSVPETEATELTLVSDSTDTNPDALCAAFRSRMSTPQSPHAIFSSRTFFRQSLFDLTGCWGRPPPDRRTASRPRSAPAVPFSMNPTNRFLNLNSQSRT
jgi:hypothetical protein